MRVTILCLFLCTLIQTITLPSIEPRSSIIGNVMTLFRDKLSQQYPHLFLPNPHPFSVSPPCLACHSVFGSLNSIPSKQFIHLLEKIGLQYCTIEKLQVKEVCKGAINAMTKYIFLALWGKYMDPHSACHRLRVCPKEYITLNSDDYAKELLKDKPDKQQQNPTQARVINVLHLSDVHIDFFYAQGKPSSCDQPVCCRYGVNAANGSSLAGYWGSNKGDCDLPFNTFNLFLEEVSKKNIDMIVWTGDNTAHDIWRQSQGYNLNFTSIISNRIKQKLPGVPVLPTIGNHESFPVNVYDFGNQKEFNEVLANAWGDWIGVDGVEQIKSNGYFSFKIEKYNLVVISLNTQAWNDQNWILLKNPTDPGKMLKWLQAKLREAEQNKNLVYILGHIPPNSALIEWGRRYNALVDRFNYIIRGQFYGHSHREHIVFFSPINDTKQRIIGNYFIPSSLTTYSGKNSNYRVMKVDVDTMRVLDYDQYTLKLQKNYTRQDIPSYELTYSFLKEYNLPSMSFENLELFREKLRTDKETQIKYSHHIHGDMSPGKPSDTLHCETYSTEEMEDICSKGSFKLSNFQKVAGPWRQLKGQ